MKTAFENVQQLTANIRTGWKTTLAGLVIIMASLASVFIEQLQIDWSNASIGLVLGLALFLAPDPKKSNKCPVVLIPLAMLIFSSCVTQERCAKKFNITSDTTQVRFEYRTEVVFDTIIKADTTTHSVFAYKIGTDTVTVENPESRAKIRYWRDAYTHLLHMQAICDSIVITDTITVTDTLLIDCPPRTTITAKARWYDLAWQWAKNIAALGFVILLLIITGLKKL